jgi:hypothetical protein
VARVLGLQQSPSGGETAAQSKSFFSSSLIILYSFPFISRTKECVLRGKRKARRIPGVFVDNS